MPRENVLLTSETFRFFRELAKHNRKEWMDANRARYQEHVVQPLRRLLEALAPSVLTLDPHFDVSGRSGTNFSRINRDIRFSKDKTPYRAQMYLKFPGQGGKGWEGGELYVGVSRNAVTVGFRAYFREKSKSSALAQIALPRVLKNPAWPRRQRQRLGHHYESYWYSMEKREWTKHQGWPLAAEEWKGLLGWIVRKRLKPGAATRPSFARDVARVLRELFPLFRFTSIRAGGAK
ncbi:MAG: DUF2461 family protein [Candidatus Acidiferrales bacterium]|jgi:uncharacterized protein (TIGR02453 family)